jgi:hypothetical protein
MSLDEPFNLKEDLIDTILADAGSWVLSALDDLNTYESVHANQNISKTVAIEFIQRALEKAIKIGSHLFKIILIFSNSDSVLPYSDLLSRNEVKGSIDQVFLDSLGNFFASILKLKEPSSFRHEPSTIMVKELRHFVPSQEYILKRLASEREVIEALISINAVNKRDSEIYLQFASQIRLYLNDVIKPVQSYYVPFINITEEVAKLKSLRPKKDFELLVYNVILLRLLHTSFGRLALFTKMSVFKDDIIEIDTLLSKIHNDLVDKKLESAIFKQIKNLFCGVFILMAYFPLSRYLGANYTKLKYPQSSYRKSNERESFDIRVISDAEDFFVEAERDIKEALLGILDWVNFSRRELSA